MAEDTRSESAQESAGAGLARELTSVSKALEDLAEKSEDPKYDPETLPFRSAAESLVSAHCRKLNDLECLVPSAGPRLGASPGDSGAQEADRDAGLRGEEHRGGHAGDG
jgi:hypothetical protein